MLCDYGCGAEGLFTMSSGRYCCSKRYNSCVAVRKRAGLRIKKAHADGKITFPEGYIPHNKGKHRPELMKADFSLNGKGNHKAILLYERGHKCESCSNTEWLGDPIPLELEHIDGNNKNQVKENLLLLCPNCHAKTSTYRGKNIKKKIVSDETLLEALQNTKSIREALESVGLVGKGGNYNRCNKLLRA